MSMPEPQTVSNGTLSIQRTCPRCEEEKLRRQPITEEEEKEEFLQTKEISGQNVETTWDLESRINAIRDGGQPLSESERAFFESRFGYDFGQVRVHTDTQAAELVRAVNARAFAVGRDIFFGTGQYAPEKIQEKRLLAHELAHVVQQGRENLPLVQFEKAIQVDIREKIILLGKSNSVKDRQEALDLIVTTYYRRPSMLSSIEYAPSFSSSPYDIETGFAEFRRPQIIKVGPRFFADFPRHFDKRARTIGHELQHVEQRTGQFPIKNSHTREFLAIYWTVTATIRGIRPLGRTQTIEYINNADKGALAHYQQMPHADQIRYQDHYEKLREIIRTLQSSGRK